MLPATAAVAGPFHLHTQNTYRVKDITPKALGRMQQLFNSTQLYDIGGTGADIKVDTGTYSGLTVRGVYHVNHPLARRLFNVESGGLAAKAAAHHCSDAEDFFPKLNGHPVAFHATSAAALDSVLANGFNAGWAGSATAAAFGKGVYFALNAMKADQYAEEVTGLAEQPADGSKLFALLVCYIHPGCAIDWVDSCTLPPEGSTREQRRTQRRTCFQDKDERILKTLPNSALQYDGIHVDGERRSMRYDEFVVYGGALNAVMPSYIVTYTRENNAIVYNPMQ